MEKITLYKDNKIDGDYEIEITELVSGFIEQEKKSGYLRNCNIERGIVLYIGVDLNSTPEDVPMNPDELTAIIEEYQRQKS